MHSTFYENYSLKSEKIIEQYFQSTEIRQPLALNSAKLSFKIWTKSKDFPDKA